VSDAVADAVMLNRCSHGSLVVRSHYTTLSVVCQSKVGKFQADIWAIAWAVTPRDSSTGIMLPISFEASSRCVGIW
jgi:hypothetical protein